MIKKINSQGGAVYIDHGSGTFESCSFEGNSADVSRHAHVGDLRLSAVNLWGAFCVLFRTFVFEKSSQCVLFDP